MTTFTAIDTHSPTNLQPLAQSRVSTKSRRNRGDASPASPIIKWVGGKGRLLSQLRPLLPSGVDRMRHVEPFAGGGAVFFDRQPRRALLSDVNANLIATYQAIRDDVDGVIEALHPLAAEHDEARYYARRTHYNHGQNVSQVQRAALFIYLNKTCFNGLHRVNRKGEFNVPIGRYENPRILDEAGLHAASACLRSTVIECTGFESLLKSARPGDFIYLDPPYEPISRTANFTAYAQGGFGQDMQILLRDVYAALSKRGCKLMLSNSDTPFIRELYKDFNTDLVAAPRAISCNGRGRGKVAEVVVRNY